MEHLIWFTSSIVIVAVIVVLGIIRIRQSFKERNNGLLIKDARGNGTLRAIALSLAVGGIVFGTDRFIGYSFFGTSMLISIIDIIKYRSTT
jgi:hypothetical protein